MSMPSVHGVSLQIGAGCDLCADAWQLLPCCEPPSQATVSTDNPGLSQQPVSGLQSVNELFLSL